MKADLKRELVFLISLVIFIISSLSAVTYFNSSGIFDADIIYINDDKLPYNVILGLETQVESDLDYNIEIIYKKENLVVSSEDITCGDNCEVKLNLDRIFFDSYEIIIKTKYEKKFYEKKLKFKLEKPKSKNKLLIKSNYFFDLNSTNYTISGKIILEKPSKLILETYPSKKLDSGFKTKIELYCENECYFDMPIKSNIIYGKYNLNLYLPDDVLTKEYFIKSTNSIIEKSKYDDTESEYLNISSYLNNFTSTPSSENITVINLFGKKQIIDVTENSRLKNIYLDIYQNDSFRTNSIKKSKPKINSISKFSQIDNTHLSSNKIIKNSKNKFVEDLPETISPLNVSLPSEMVLPSSLNISNSVVYEEESLSFNNGESQIDLNSNLFKNSSLQEQRKLIPGIYKKEKIIRYLDGKEEIFEDYYAFGLISINTKKPLYHIDETTEILIVVLDKWGYLVSDANIVLNISKPSGEDLIFSTDNFDIIETSKSGVYSLELISDELGEYNLYAQVELEEMVVDINSYYNVVENYDFEILRDVPATIDPWEGPFTNIFTIIPLNSYDETYNFTEVFSSDFTQIETDADEIKTIGDTTYLIWRDLTGVSNLRYSAQVPLKSPVLYHLGKSYIDYENGDEFRFYENRSWLFAIDPAAKVCDFTSPCICGAACSGGHEPGDGTIDGATDGTTTYEYVNDLRVTDLNGSYFGTGDTVEICMDSQTDASGSGDRVTIGYKDASGGWVNGHVVQEWQHDNNNLNTDCVNVVLNNYVGTHNFRGKVVWQWTSEPANRISSGATYRDHDDINITVLERRAAYYTSWNIDNETSIGNGLKITRGNNATIFANWDKALQYALVRHNGNGSFTDYSISNLNNNFTNYSVFTSNLSQFPSLGIVNISYIDSYDFYFNLSNKTSPAKYFEIWGSMKINQSKMEPYIIYNGSKINISCQVTDESVNLPYANVNVSFYNNVTGYLNSSITNSSGWANISYIENIVGSYTITCNVSDQNANYLKAGINNYADQILTVKANNTDITPPVIVNVSSSPSLFSIGGKTLLRANVTDETNLTAVYVNITLPDSSSFEYPMINVYSNWFEYNFTLTTLDGNYAYHIIAYDNSSNKVWTSNKYFVVAGIRTYIGIKTSKDVYKLGEVINLTGYTKTSLTNSSSVYETGDINYIYYSFDSSDEGWTHSGAQDEWERGVPSTGDLNVCESGNCWCTDLNANYNNNANNNIRSPVIDMTGRTNAKVNFWREILFADATNDKIYFESYDGTSWNILYQNTIGATNQEGAFYTYYPSEVEGVSNAQFRFRTTTNGGSVQEGFTFDSFNLSFDPRQDWDKNWIYYNTSFGSNNNKTTAIKIEINVTSYSSSSSDVVGNDNPDLEIQVYNGSTYSGSYKCNLDSSKSYPYICSFVIKNTPEYLDAWESSSNRYIRIRALGVDSYDYINWTNVKREYAVPSLIENHGIAQVTSILLEQFKNSTGGIVKTMYNASIELNSSEIKQLNTYWNFSVPSNFRLGNYSAYVALTDAFGNILQNEDDNTYINDSYIFSVQSLLINIINPLMSSIQNESFYGNITLDTTNFASGGWCGYSFDSGPNITMNLINISNFNKLFGNISDGLHNITFKCNDSDNYIVESELIKFNVSQAPRLSYIFPTDSNNSWVNRSWTYINISINDSSLNSTWLMWEGGNESMSCNSISSVEYYCYINKSFLKNGIYQYFVCANDSIGNTACSINRTININKTLHNMFIISPNPMEKFILGSNVSLNISTSTEVNWSGYSLDFNFSKRWNLTKNSPLNWSSIIFNLETGYHTIYAYSNDSSGNEINTSVVFYLIPDKNIIINKNIISVGNDIYEINLNVTNYGNYSDYILYDFINSNFSYSNFSITNDGSNSVLGFYTGTLLTWNLSLNYLSYFNVSYLVNGSKYNLNKNYIFALD